MVLCHWPLNVTLQLARAAAVLELIGQFFLQLHLLKFLCDACMLYYCIAQVWCPAVCAKLNMMFELIVESMLTRLKSFGWFY
jgi:hypothetical protein